MSPALAAVAIALFVGCAGPSASRGGPALAPADPTPLARCRVGQTSTSPLVTEWPASEKAHLQANLGVGPVAVSYTGCELHIIDSCKVPGSYLWRRTTLATDTVEITNADELYAKLPLGALSLEGELERTGRLAVQTTVAGQLQIEGSPAELAKDGSCAGVTHVVSGISVGAFKMLSGGAMRAGGGVSFAKASSATSESVMREAGVPASCADSTEEAPDPQCASPIQVFLAPISAGKAPRAGASRGDDEEEGRTSGVLIRFPEPPDRDEHWTLRDYEGKELCRLPCQRWVRPNSGHYLQRERPGESDLSTVKLPDRFAQPPGTTVDARYQAERGSPLLSKLTFYGLGIPAGAVGIGLIIWGFIGQCDIRDPNYSSGDCDKETEPVLIIGGALDLAVGLGSAYWFFWSHPGAVETYAPGASESAFRLGVGPGGLVGVF